MKCKYCNKESCFQYCNDVCKQKCDEFDSYCEKYKYLFLALIVIEILGFLLVTPFITSGDFYLYMSIWIIAMGITMYVFPFATPETIDMIGLKKCIKIVKAIGIGLCVAGIIIAVLCTAYLG